MKSQIKKPNDGIEKCVCISIFTLHLYCKNALFCKCILLNVNVKGLLKLYVFMGFPEKKCFRVIKKSKME